MLAAQWATAFVGSGRSWTGPNALIASAIAFVDELEREVERLNPPSRDDNVVILPKKMKG